MQQWWKKQKLFSAIAHNMVMDIGAIGSAVPALQAVARPAATIRSAVSDFYSHR